MTRKKKGDARQVQRELMGAVKTWHKGLGLDVCGVDLGECLEYPLLQTLVGAELSKAQQEGGGDGQ